MIKPLLRQVALGMLLVLPAMPSHAQFGGMAPSGVNVAFSKLFGSHTNFSASVDAQVLDQAGKDWVRVPLELASMDQKLVMDVDLSKAVSRDLPEFALSSLKQAGMSRVISIVRPDKKATFLVYPGAQSYVTMPLTAEDAAAVKTGFKVETVPAGKETLGGKERAKNKVVVRDAKGASMIEATTWNAPELGNFPVQIETRQDKMTLVLRFSNLSFAKPNAAKFELSPAFMEYKDVQQMMVGIMKQIVSGSIGGDGKQEATGVRKE